MSMAGGESPIPLTWEPGLDVMPVKHGSAVFAMALRQLLWSRRYDAIAIAFPAGWDEAIHEGIEALPEVQAAVFRDRASPRCYLPFDPCDAYIEAWRQASQRGIPCLALEDDTRLTERRDIPLPDAHLLSALGVAEYHRLAVQGLEGEEASQIWRVLARRVTHELRRLKAKEARVLFVCDYPLLPWVEKLYAEKPIAPGEDNTVCDEARVYPVKPEHLYFALGEPPFFAAEVERERQNPLAMPKPYFELVKTLFLRTREQFLEQAVERRSVTVKGVQQSLTYARNLAALEGALTPSLLNLLIAAKGVLGSGFARRLLEAGRFYPFMHPEKDQWLQVGPDRIQEPDEEAISAFNLLEDQPKLWKSLRLKPEPDRKKQKSYRYAWDARGLCSHLPEDARIERFNRVVRTRARDRDPMSHHRVERMTSSLKDGIDIRETLRQWHSQKVYVREVPPQTRHVDTVIMIFDDSHDERYPQQVTWYAEHPEESTLTFYATDPMARMIGPGIAEAEYGGLSLLFPPRQVPDIFSLPADALGLRGLAEQLVYGALLHSREKSLAYVAERRPSLRLRLLARRFGRRLVHIPLGSFSAETLRKMRRFHMLNGKHVRSWASRFIEE